MIPDLDIYRSANLLVKEHGAGADCRALICERFQRLDEAWPRSRLAATQLPPRERPTPRIPVALKSAEGIFPDARQGRQGVARWRLWMAKDHPYGTRNAPLAVPGARRNGPRTSGGGWGAITPSVVIGIALIRTEVLGRRLLLRPPRHSRPRARRRPRWRRGSGWRARRCATGLCRMARRPKRITRSSTRQKSSHRWEALPGYRCRSGTSKARSRPRLGLGPG